MICADHYPFVEVKHSSDPVYNGLRNTALSALDRIWVGARRESAPLTELDVHVASMRRVSEGVQLTETAYLYRGMADNYPKGTPRRIMLANMADLIVMLSDFKEAHDVRLG